MASSSDSSPHSPRHLRVVLASPSDVQAERDVIARLIEELNRTLDGSHGVHLDLFRWEVDGQPGFHPEGGQGKIDEHMRIEASDLLLGLFWTKFGSKLKSGMTGTEHEIRKAIAANETSGGPEIHLYFCTRPVDPSTLDPDQLAAIKKFRDEVGGLGLYKTFDSDRDLERKVREHITHWLNAEYARPKAETPEPDGSGPKPPSISPTVLRRNPLFTGREDELAQIHRSLAGGVATLTSGVAALHGMGGEGKTSTAVEYAYRHADEYARIFMVRAERPGDFENGLATLAEELGLPEAGAAEQEAQVRAVVRWFQATPSWLLIVDNAEGLPSLKPRLPRHPQGKVLVTSRETPTGDFGQAVPILHLSDEAGALLLLRCAGRASPLRSGGEGPGMRGVSPTSKGQITLGGYAMNAAEFEDAKRVSNALGGLALALDHAGVYMMRQGMSPAVYLDRFKKHRSRMLDKDLNRDHATVTVTVAQGLEQVEAIPKFGPAAAQLIRLCAFLAPDAIPDEVFRKAANKMEPPLGALVDDDLAWDEVVEAATRFALIRREAEPMGFSLHRLVAEVVRDGMSDGDRRAWTERAVAAAAAAFPKADYPYWPLCAHLLPHALALRVAAAERGIASPAAAQLLSRTATYLRQRGRYAEALPFYRGALGMHRRLHDGDHREIAVALNNLGVLLKDMGDYLAAAEALEEAIDIADRLPAVDNLSRAVFLNALADVYYRQGRDGEAVELWQQAFELTESSVGPDHPSLAAIKNNLANGLVDLKRFAEADPLLVWSLNITRATLGEGHPETATALMNLGILYVRWNRPADAAPLLEQARDLWDDLHGGEHADCARPRLWLALLAYEPGDLLTARDLFHEALTIQERFLGPTHPETVSTREWLEWIERKIAASAA